MQDTTGKCETLNQCVQEMEIYFQKILQDDKTNTYVTLAWCGKVSDSKPDEDGNVWWYDGWDSQIEGNHQNFENLRFCSRKIYKIWIRFRQSIFIFVIFFL